MEVCPTIQRLSSGLGVGLAIRDPDASNSEQLSIWAWGSLALRFLVGFAGRVGGRNPRIFQEHAMMPPISLVNPNSSARMQKLKAIGSLFGWFVLSM